MLRRLLLDLLFVIAAVLYVLLRKLGKLLFGVRIGNLPGGFEIMVIHQRFIPSGRILSRKVCVCVLPFGRCLKKIFVTVMGIDETYPTSWVLRVFLKNFRVIPGCVIILSHLSEGICRSDQTFKFTFYIHMNGRTVKVMVMGDVGRVIVDRFFCDKCSAAVLTDTGFVGIVYFDLRAALCADCRNQWHNKILPLW